MKPVSRIGLDIGSHAIRMVELLNSKEGSRLLCFGYRKIDNVSDEVLPGIIREVLSEAKSGAKDVVFGVSGPQVITRFISIPNMPDKDIKSALAFEVEKNIPFSPEEINYDYQILERGTDKKLEVLLTAAKKALLERYIGIAKSAGLNLEVIDVNCLALANAFLKNFQFSLEPNRTSALINIGEKYTNLAILRGEILGFVRDIQIGGTDLNVTQLETNLVHEARVSFEYFENRFGKGVDDVYLSGDFASMSGIKAVLDESLGAKSETWDPFKVIIFDEKLGASTIPNDLRSDYAVSVGLALR